MNNYINDANGLVVNNASGTIWNTTYNCSVPGYTNILGGPCQGGMASTVLDLTVSPPAILRPGPVTADALGEFVDLKAD